MAKVLLALDGSDFARAAITQGARLLGPGHQLVAITVVQPPYVGTTAMAPMETMPSSVPDPATEAALLSEHQREAEAHLGSVAAELDADLERRVAVGEPGTELCAQAATLAADVIGIGSHGHGLLKRMLLGSVSHHVLHHAPCAVLVVRSDEVSSDRPASTDR
ncbi:universal stress protein [soil metagenome]